MTLNKEKRAEQIRTYLNNKSLSKNGLERSIAIIVTHIEKAVTEENENSLKIMAAIADNPITFIDALEVAAIKNGEITN